MTQVDLFSQLNNALLDLQGANLQTFERPLKKISMLLNSPDLEAINGTLKNGLDLEKFLEASFSTERGMVGSASLLWPEDHEETMGLTLLLIDKLAADPNFATNFGHHFFYTGNKVIAGIREFTKQLIIPFVRDYKLYIEMKGKVEPNLRLPMTNKVFRTSISIIGDLGVILSPIFTNICTTRPDNGEGSSIEALSHSIVT